MQEEGSMAEASNSDATFKNPPPPPSLGEYCRVLASDVDAQIDKYNRKCNRLFILHLSIRGSYDKIPKPV